MLKTARIRDKAGLDAAFAIRTQVFVEEQGVPVEREMDEHDASALHVLAYYEEKPVATGRMRMLDGMAKLERICVLAECRKSGAGKAIMLELERNALEQGAAVLKLNAQRSAEGFYKRLGYRTISGEFMEEGIPHVTMTKPL